MKTLLLSTLALAAIVSLTACESDGDHHDHNRGAQTTTTTVEESTVQRPVSATTTETHSIRAY